MTKRERADVIVGKLQSPGEFIHIDGRTPRLASGEVVPRAVLKVLEAEGVVEVVNRDLFRERAMQYGRAVEAAINRAVNPPLVVDVLAVPEGSMPRAAVVPQFREDGATRWSEGNRLAARACWLSGQSKAEVARRFNTSRGFIVRMARVDQWPAAR